MTLYVNTQVSGFAGGLASFKSPQSNPAIDKPLTAAEYRALYAARQDSIRAPGCWTLPQGNGVTTQSLNRLVKRGLLERKIESENTGRLSGRRNRTTTWTYFRVTDRACELLKPELPPVPVRGPHYAQRLSDAAVDAISDHFLPPTYLKSSVIYPEIERWVFTSDTAVTFYHAWYPDEDLSTEAFAANLLAYIRLTMPRAVITGVQIYGERPVHHSGGNVPRDIRGLFKRWKKLHWVAISFYFAGEDMPLLAAPKVAGLLPANVSTTSPTLQAAVPTAVSAPVRAQTEVYQRPDDDFFPTPESLCRVALRQLDVTAPQRVLDPGCGAGPWGRAARERWPGSHVLGVELTEDRVNRAHTAGVFDAYNQVLPCDYLTLSPNAIGRFDVIIGNPPFKLGEGFVMKSLNLLAPDGTLIFLLRLAFLESQGRYKRLYSDAAKPAAVHILAERPSFTGNGKTDATAYALFVWHQGWTGQTALHWLSWRSKGGA